jgi:peptidoglycan/LPS O-acetylase OafA/YrhL
VTDSRQDRLTAATLATKFDPRHNSLTFMRLGLAVAVAVVHGQKNGFHWQTHIGETEIGQIAVDGFFIVSGLLVARSYLSLHSFPRFAWHRFLRIMPGFWTCLFITALIVAPVVALIEGRSPGSVFLGDRSALAYMGRNAGLLMEQYDIAGLLQSVPNRGVFDGPLWTLVFEAACYALLGALGVCGILRQRRWVVCLSLLGLWSTFTMVQTGVLNLPGTMLADLLRFAFVFSLGATAWLYAERLPISWPLAVAALGLLVVALLTQDRYQIVGGVGLAYLLIWLSVRAPRWTPTTDLSYGMYIYHWPVQQLMALLGLTTLGVTPYIALSLLAAAACAFASWHLIESPALRHKNARWVTHLERRHLAPTG